MKLNATKLKIFGFLLLFSPLVSLSQTTIPNAYLCGSGTIKLTPAFSGYTPAAGDKIIWSVNGVPEPSVSYNSADDAIYKVAANLSPGNYKYAVQVVPSDANLCPSTISDNVIIEKLPLPQMALNAPGSSYCTDQTASTILTASNTNTSYVLPSGVTLVYAWSATKDGVVLTSAELSNLGMPSSNTETFALNASVAPATYVFTAIGSYATVGVPILPATPCTAMASKTITVSAKPGKATITIVP